MTRRYMMPARRGVSSPKATFQHYLASLAREGGSELSALESEHGEPRRNIYKTSFFPKP
jgi:hypothetical protein